MDGRKDGKIVSAASGKPEKIPGVTYNGLSSHTGRVAVPLATSFYGDWDKLSWCLPVGPHADFTLTIVT